MITATDVANLFGDFLSQLGDASLREKVVATWVAGCEQGGWKAAGDLQALPFTLLTDTHGTDFVTHTRAVTAGALALARAQTDYCKSLPYGINFDYLIAGGLLHDVGKLLELQPDGSGGYCKSHSGRCARHPISGAILAAEQGIPQEIINMIACHSKEGDGMPQRVETLFIHYADFASFNPLRMLASGQLIVEG